MLKVLLIFLFTIFLTTTAVLRAEQCPPSCPCPSCEEYGKGQGLEPVEEMQLAYNAPARIDVCGCWNTFITASFIYWLPYMQGLEVGYLEKKPSEYVFDRKILTHSFEYAPGLKVGLGTHFDHDNWDLYAEYTGLTMTSQKTHTTTAPSTIERTWDIIVAVIGSSYRVDSKWKPAIHILDVELGRSQYIGTRLIFRIHFGGRAGWIFHKFRLKYFQQVTGDIFEVKVKDDNWLIGPRLRLDTSWIIYNGFRLLGNFAATLAYQKFDPSINIINIVTLEKRGKSKLESNKGVVTPIFDLGGALAWGTYFCNNNWFFDLQVSYDFSYFFNQNKMRNVADRSFVLSESTDMMLRGLTVTARLDF